MIVDPFRPPEVHTVAVVVVKVTVSPDEAVALTVSGDCIMFLLPIAAKEIVWFRPLTWRTAVPVAVPWVPVTV